MAVDTRNKRSSVIGLTLPWRGMLPAPDGTVGQADRQHTAWVYSGIQAGEPAVPTGGPGGLVVMAQVYVPGSAWAAVYCPRVSQAASYAPGSAEAKVVS